MQLGMTDILQRTHKSYVSKVIIEPVGRIYQVVFCRKTTGVHGWEPGRPHYLREGTPSLKRARRAALALSANGSREAMERGVGD